MICIIERNKAAVLETFGVDRLDAIPGLSVRLRGDREGWVLAGFTGDALASNTYRQVPIDMLPKLLKAFRAADAEEVRTLTAEERGA